MKALVVKLPSAPVTPTADQLVARIRAMCLTHGGMRFDHPHVQRRLTERTLNMRQVLETVRKGSPTGSPELDQWGDWRIKLRRTAAGRKVQVIVAVKTDHFVVVTVI
jgi:Domain of unknown function (DUF4258)